MWHNKQTKKIRSDFIKYTDYEDLPGDYRKVLNDLNQGQKQKKKKKLAEQYKS